MSTANQSANTSGSRSRPQARKRAHDDAAYFGPPAPTTKRIAQERPDGEPRVKRKRVDPSSTAASRRADRAAAAASAAAAAAAPEESSTRSLIDLKALPDPVLYRYLSHFNLLPDIHPSPLLPDDPPSPHFLYGTGRNNSRALSPTVLPTPANRPRRDPKEQSRRRSSRLLEEALSRPPIMSDVADVHVVLAEMAERHLEGLSINEIDTLASFMVKTKCE